MMMANGSDARSKWFHCGPCGDRRFGRSVGEFETCFWAGSSFWSCGFGRGGGREGGWGRGRGRECQRQAVCRSQQLTETEMTDLLACLTRLTNFIISLTEGMRRRRRRRRVRDGIMMVACAPQFGLPNRIDSLHLSPHHILE